MKTALALALIAFTLHTTLAEVAPGQDAPGFKLKSSADKEVSLSDYKGKTVVLEWVNYDCPFVKKFYSVGTMQTLQKTYADRGVVWLQICSSSAGKQGYFDNAEIVNRSKAVKAASTAYLVDSDGKVGKAYGAKTTPHIFIINPEGKVAYAGAMDSIKSADSADISKADNYVARALEEILEGKPVSKPSTTPYGCSVKY